MSTSTPFRFSATGFLSFSGGEARIASLADFGAGGGLDTGWFASTSRASEAEAGDEMTGVTFCCVNTTHKTTKCTRAHASSRQQGENTAKWRGMTSGSTVVYLSVGPIGEKHMHALKRLACRKRVAAASSPAATCKQDAALTSRARHAGGCARPSRARLRHRSSKI